MCDYSLTNVASRPAKVGDKLITRNFGSGTTGFCGADEENVAICVLPGTEIAFDEPFKTPSPLLFQTKKYTNVAIFRQINKELPHTHHDALETPSGEVVLLTGLILGQRATVLQLPAAPKNETEAKEQERLAVVA